LVAVAKPASVAKPIQLAKPETSEESGFSPSMFIGLGISIDAIALSGPKFG